MVYAAHMQTHTYTPTRNLIGWFIACLERKDDEKRVLSVSEVKTPTPQKRDYNLFDEMAQCLRLRPPLRLKEHSIHSKIPAQISKLGVRCCSVNPGNAYKLVTEVKEKLGKEHSSLPVGKNGRDDEDMIFWFLKDRKFSVNDAVSKLTKAIRWRHEFGVSELSEESIKSAVESGKAYVHDYLDVYHRPVLVVDVSKHFPGKQDIIEDEKLCVFMIEKALSKLPSAGKNEILVIIDLRGFRIENVDIKFLIFVFDVFYYYYPRRLGQVLFVDAPFIFKPVWQLVKPLLKSYASLVKFCSAEDLRKEYFTADTVPPNFKKRRP